MDVINLIVCAHDVRAAADRLNGRYPAGAAEPGSGPAAPAMTYGVSAGACLRRGRGIRRRPRHPARRHPDSLRSLADQLRPEAEHPAAGWC